MKGNAHFGHFTKLQNALSPIILLPPLPLKPFYMSIQLPKPNYLTFHYLYTYYYQSNTEIHISNFEIIFNYIHFHLKL